MSARRPCRHCGLEPGPGQFCRQCGGRVKGRPPHDDVWHDVSVVALVGATCLAVCGGALAACGGGCPGGPDRAMVEVGLATVYLGLALAGLGVLGWLWQWRAARDLTGSRVVPFGGAERRPR